MLSFRYSDCYLPKNRLKLSKISKYDKLGVLSMTNTAMYIIIILLYIMRNIVKSYTIDI